MAHLIAGPACGMYLADMGADVIKVENPGSGDASRTAYARHLNGESAVFVTVNRNKRSVGLDLAHPDGRRVFHRLEDAAAIGMREIETDAPLVAVHRHEHGALAVQMARVRGARRIAAAGILHLDDV